MINTCTFNGNSNSSVFDGSASLVDLMPCIGRHHQNKGKLFSELLFMSGLRHFLIACHSSGPQHQPHLSFSQEAQTSNNQNDLFSNLNRNSEWKPVSLGFGIKLHPTESRSSKWKNIIRIYMKAVHKSCQSSDSLDWCQSCKNVPTSWC